MKLCKKLSFLCLILIFLFSGCSLAKSIEKLPSEKPKDFGLVFNYGVGAKNQLDTIKGQFTKDMILDSSVTTGLKLSEEEMNDIYSEMQKINILNYPDTFKPKSNVRQTPYTTYNIKIMYDGKEKSISWHDESVSKSAEAVQLRALFRKVQDIIMSKEEYKKLPEVKGGYQ